MAIALLLASVVVLLLNLDSVAVVGDSNQISAMIPLPMLPSLEMVDVLIMPAMSILFFASARTMEDLLPKADKVKRAVVILRLHGRSRIDSTFILILERYAGRLQANGGKIM